MVGAWLKFAFVKKTPLPGMFVGYLFILYGVIAYRPILVPAAVVTALFLALWLLIVWIDWPMERRALLKEQRLEDARLDWEISQYEMRMMNEEMGEPYWPVEESR